MEKRLFDVIPEHGITQYWHYDDQSDKATIESVQSHTHITEANKSVFNETSAHARYQDGMQKVARIPLVILQGLMQRGILQDKKRFKEWLNDPQNRHFRTRPGKV